MRSPEGMKMTWSLWAGFAGLGMVWWLAVRMLWVEWEVDPQYGYGFLVPIFFVTSGIQDDIDALFD